MKMTKPKYLLYAFSHVFLVAVIVVFIMRYQLGALSLVRMLVGCSIASIGAVALWNKFLNDFADHHLTLYQERIKKGEVAPPQAGIQKDIK